MNQSVKEKWVAALESGEYEQTTGFLHVVEDFENGSGEGVKSGWCCLGVLCDVARKNGLEIEVRRTLDGDIPRHYEFFDRDESFLPEKVAQWAELDATKIYTFGEGPDERDRDLVDANDSGVSFAEIAQALREQA